MKRRLALAGLLVTVGAAVTAAQSRTVWDSVYSEAQAKRGEVVHAQACANCHGAELEAWTCRPLAGGDFTSKLERPDDR